VAEQTYLAVLAVIGEGRTITEVAGRWGFRGRRSMRGWSSMRLVGWRVCRTVRGGRSCVRIR